MTDIPEMYLAEAVRRLNAEYAAQGLAQTLVWNSRTPATHALALTLQELGWTPPIDEARMAKARKVAAAVLEASGYAILGRAVSRVVDMQPQECSDAILAIQAAYDALGED